MLTQYLGWRWNFFVNVPIGIFAILGILRWVPAHDEAAQDTHLDLPGAVLVTGGLMALVYALTLASNSGWTAPATLVAFGVSLVLLASFLINERRTAHPLVPLSIFRIRNVSGGNMIMLPVMAGGLGIGFFASLYVQNVLHYSPALSGLSFLPIPTIIGFVSIRAPRLIDRFGFKPLMVVGTALMGIGVYLLSLLNTQSSYLLHLLPAFSLFALGAGLSIVAVSVAATSGVRDDEAGLASGLLNTSQQVGGALGLAVLADVASTTTAAALTTGLNPVQASLQGYQQAFLWAAILMGVALVVSVAVIRAPRKAQPERTADRGCESPSGSKLDLDGC